MHGTYRKKIASPANEYWWGGTVNAGTRMPFSEGDSLDMRGDTFGNQAAPLLLSSHGRYIWSEEPFAFSCKEGVLELEGKADFVLAQSGNCLKSAYLAAGERFFPPSGKTPDSLLFSAPQYNTWIEMHSNQAQEPILHYARTLIKEGYQPGVLMIDEGWQRYFGDWTFCLERFPDPAGMVKALHDLGFKVMLWVIPFVVTDSKVFRQLRQEKALVLNADGSPALREWWNGYSAVIDLTGGRGRSWFLEQLRDLQDKYDIDGFKLDGGDSRFYRDNDQVTVSGSANAHSEAFAEFGLSFALSEYRACWKCGGQALAQRLQDKLHAWNERGLGSVVPNSIVQGLLGYPFSCPDMIGGGEYRSFADQADHLDQELFVRYAQASALMPMMQFSAAPWRVLDREHARLCLKAANLHDQFRHTILALAEAASKTGEPIIRHMAYEWPDAHMECVTDQFMLGSDTLVAPVLTKGATSRQVHLPPAKWQADNGQIYSGPDVVTVDTPLCRLPYFKRYT